MHLISINKKRREKAFPSASWGWVQRVNRNFVAIFLFSLKQKRQPKFGDFTWGRQKYFIVRLKNEYNVFGKSAVPEDIDKECRMDRAAICLLYSSHEVHGNNNYTSR